MTTIRTTDALPQLRHEPQHQRFVADLPGGQCEAVYRLVGRTAHIVHTEVPAALRGRGLGAQLMDGVLAQVRALGWTVRPVCSYARAHMLRNPDNNDLLET